MEVPTVFMQKVAGIKRAVWPVADSLAAAAAAISAPVALLRAAKRAACPGFVGSRVNLNLVIPWVLQNLDEVLSTDWHVEYTKAATRRLQLANARLASRSVSRDEVETEMKAFALAMRRILTRHLVNAWPLKVTGKGIPSARKVGRETVDGICRDLQRFCETFASPK